LHSQIFIVVSENRDIGKDQRCDCRCPPVLPTKEEKLQEYQNPGEEPEDSNTFSPPPRSPIPVESSPSSLEVQIQQAPSPPQPQEELHTEEPLPEEPQPKDTLADVHEETADPASLIITSVVFSIQTSTIPPQGNIFSMKSLPMNLLLPSYNYFCQSFS